MLNKIIFGSSFLWFLTISSFSFAVIVFGGGVSAMPSESPTNSSESPSQEGKKRGAERPSLPELNEDFPELTEGYGEAGAGLIVGLEGKKREIINEFGQDLKRHNEAQNRKLQELLNRSKPK